MNPTRKYLTRALKSLIEFCHETGNEDLLLILAQATAKPEDPPIDRRRGAWSEARKAAHAAKAKEVWDSRQEITSKNYQRYQYAGEAPITITDLSHFCVLTNMSMARLRDELKTKPEGFIQYEDGFPVVYAKSEAGRDKLLHSVYSRTNNTEDIIHLQKRGSKRF